MPKIHRTAFACLLAAGAMAAPAVHAEVWKCLIDGKVHYSDQPCPTKGEPLPQRALQGNVVDTSADRAAIAERARAASAEERAAAAAPSGGGAAAQPVSSNVCPSERDIAGMETKASSISLSPEAKRFIQDEIRRARQCQKGQGSYSAADWNVSKQAVDAQSSLTGGADARRRAEAMHSAADANEGDRIQRQRELEDRDAARRERGRVPPASSPR
jgi:hypothetical protein